MTDQIVLTIPEELSARVREIARTTNQAVEQVLLEHLKTLSTPILSPEQQAELDALHQLSDDALWTIAHEQVPADVQARADELMQKTDLAAEEQAELDKLVERADRVMVRKAEAAHLLQTRGFMFTRADFKA